MGVSFVTNSRCYEHILSESLALRYNEFHFIWITARRWISLVAISTVRHLFPTGTRCGRLTIAGQREKLITFNPQKKDAIEN